MAKTGTFVGCAETGGSIASRIVWGGRKLKFSPSDASKLGRPPECDNRSGWIDDQVALPGSSLSSSGGEIDGSARNCLRSNRVTVRPFGRRRSTQKKRLFET